MTDNKPDKFSRAFDMMRRVPSDTLARVLVDLIREEPKLAYNKVLVDLVGSHEFIEAQRRSFDEVKDDGLPTPPTLVGK